MAQYVNDPVPRYKREDLPGTTRKLRDYVVGLTDQLQYLLGNLDADNIPELDGIRKRLSDAEGNVASLTLTAQGLTLSVQDQNDRFAALSVSIEGIGTQVGNLEGSLSTVTQTVSGIETRVQSAEGNISSLTQTASSLSTKISTAEGNISSLTQTVTSLSSSLSTAEGNISSLTQTASGLTSRVSTAEGSISGLEQTASGLSSKVSSLDGKYSSLKQTVDGFDIVGDINNVMEDGVGAINFVYGSTQVGRLIAIDRSLFELWAIDNMFVGSGGETTISSGGGDVNIDGAWEVNITSSGGNIVLKPDGYVRIYATSSRFWEFRNTGIYYCSKSTDYSKAVIESL